jgi:hypothetical protein
VYTPKQIATALNAPLANVQATWPPTLTALDWQHINTHAVRAAMAATIAVETGISVNGQNMTFLSVAEEDGPSSGPHAWYAPWYGRGTIQCTLQGNYSTFGPLMDPPLNLIANPDLLLQQVPSAQYAALFFVANHIPALAEAALAEGDTGEELSWRAIRAKVNGGDGYDRIDGGATNGVNAFLDCVHALLAIPEEPDAPLVTTVAVAGALKTEPNHTSPAAIDEQHKPVQLAIGTVIEFCADPGTGKPWSGQTTAGDWAHLRPQKSPAHGWYLRQSLTAPHPATTGA